MPPSRSKRSSRIRLLLLGAATLASSGCQHLPPVMESPQLYNTELECLDDWMQDWGVDGCRRIQTYAEDGTLQWYWYYGRSGSAYWNGSGGFAQNRRRMAGQPPNAASALPAESRVVRRGFGWSGSRFGGAFS